MKHWTSQTIAEKLTWNQAQNWTAIIEWAVDFRHRLHRRPELGWSENRTAAKIREVLTTLGIAWRACAGTGTVATLAAETMGRHIALRADIDALPVEEATGAAWTSRTSGCMHACGHDGHTASLLAAARWLQLHEQMLPGPVTLVFQPAEEGGHGARRMIEERALAGVEAIFGWHNWPAIPFGRAVCSDGVVMAGNGTFKLVVRGRGGHASQPELCRDPVLAASAIVLALQQIVSRQLPPQQATVLSVTSIDGRSAETIIPEQVTLAGSFRFADPAQREPLVRLLEEIAGATARAYGAECEVTIYPRYGATINHPGEAARYRRVLQDEFGAEAIDVSTPVPIMASEDFSYYLAEIPGAFALIGADDGRGHDIPCHNPRYDFNDALIGVAARLFSRLAGAPVPQ